MDTPGALQGLRVLDLSDDKGQFCTKLMADMGADVIKIEPPAGDPVRRLGPFYHDQEALNNSLYWFMLNAADLEGLQNLHTAGGISERVYHKIVDANPRAAYAL